MAKGKRRRRGTRKMAPGSMKDHSWKDLECSKACGETVRVTEETESVICALCACKMVGPTDNMLKRAARGERKKSGRPRGWHLKPVFVDKEGNVFHKGIEQPSLKGTLPETIMETKPKLTKFERMQRREARKAKKLERLAKKYKKIQHEKKADEFFEGDAE